MKWKIDDLEEEIEKYNNSKKANKTTEDNTIEENKKLKEEIRALQVKLNESFLSIENERKAFEEKLQTLENKAMCDGGESKLKSLATSKIKALEKQLNEVL